jgi:hypothetical protein
MPSMHSFRVVTDRLLLPLLALAAGCGAARPAAPAEPAAAQHRSPPGKAASAEEPVASEPAPRASAEAAAAPTPAGIEAPGTGAIAAAEPGKPTEGPAAAPTPRVRVKYIGLHIGGGPNDKATKAPFERAIAKRFPELVQCYAQVEKPGSTGSFGLDLLVPAVGGHATTSNPRTALPGVAFRECVVHVFETVDFDEPKHGTTKLSYSVRFDPEGT